MRIAVTAASPAVVSTDPANAGVILFTGAPAVTQGTPYPIGTTLVAPVGNSGTWLNVASSAASGTLFKFTRRGVYRVAAMANGTPGSVLAAQLGITVDCAAAQCVIGTSALTPASTGLIDYEDYTGVATVAVPMRAEGIAYITDALAGGAQPVPVAGTFSGGVGVMRVHATTGANAALTTQFVVASIRAQIAQLGDVAG